MNEDLFTLLLASLASVVVVGVGALCYALHPYLFVAYLTLMATLFGLSFID
jgi:hypothetical protein